MSARGKLSATKGTRGVPGIPRWWRLLIIACATLILCSCRLTSYNAAVSGPSVVPSGAANEAAAVTPLPNDATVDQNYYPVQQVAYHAGPGPGVAAPMHAISTSPPPSPALPYYGAASHCPPGYGAAAAEIDPNQPWQPPGIRGPWPRDEYVCDGGDQEIHAKVGPDFRVYGMDPQDTIVHYDTLDGRREVEESNKLCIYAPRFAAVRQVKGLFQHQVREPIGRVHNPVAAALHRDQQLAGNFNQPLQAVGQIGSKSASTFRERTLGVPLESRQGLIGIAGDLRLDLRLQVIESGIFDQSQKARLAQAVQAAITWTHDTGVQLMINDQRLVIDTHDTKLGETIVYEHEGTPRMRIIKIASKSDAKSGEEVEFTLRFDNIGDEEVGNVTIIDNLTTRLEYVPDSQQCTLPAEFYQELNEAESLALTWEITEPVQPGQGGIIRFRCRVR